MILCLALAHLLMNIISEALLFASHFTTEQLPKQSLCSWDIF